MEASLVTAAALIALAGALFHGVAGGKIYMGHMKASELMPLTQSLSLVAWQMFTVFLVVGGATLLCVAMKSDLALLAYPVLVGNALGAVLLSLLGVMGQARLLKFAGHISDGPYRAPRLAGNRLIIHQIDQRVTRKRHRV
tara:strand:- start:109 stop:528 length:420 start_codon:yes stop_codon:yes gene_type:complete